MSNPRASVVVILGLASVLAGCDLGSVPPLAPGGGGAADAGYIPGQRFHPADFAQAAVHGTSLKRQELDCRSCHGATLSGETMAAAPSCDTCHTPAQPTAWRTDCTFCHGGDDNTTGAPPSNLDGTTGPGVFPAHTAHVSTQMAAPIDCVQCHVKANDVLSEGHVFDTTPARADVDFGAGSSPQAVFAAETGCSSLYCHGNGRADDGAVAQNAGVMTCSSCHASLAGGATGWATMSGLHGLHLAASGVTCGDCHQDVTTDGNAIADASKHVNGQRDVAFTEAAVSMNVAAQTCTGTCHGHPHTDRGWGGDGSGGGTVHPAGFAASAVHGPEMALQRQDCRGCHGATLTGSGSAPSCNGCHQETWRTDCVYCHGGTANSTGAPGRDPGAPAGSLSASFVAHTAHVTGGAIARPYDCVQCHAKPADVLSAGHAFDSSPGSGEVVMTSGLSPAGVYDGAGGCSTMYCHGNGRGNNGSYRDGNAPVTCASCHPAMNSSEAAWTTMSGDHRKHLQIDGVTCGDCHRTVTTNGTTIASTALHIDRQRAVSFSVAGITYNVATKRCSGPCHGENHDETW